MNKVWLVIKREYTSRVMKKSFLLITLLTPLGIGLIMFLAGYMASKGSESSKKILLHDDSGIVNKDSLKGGEFVYQFTTEPMDSLKKNYINKGYDMLLYIPPVKDSLIMSHEIEYYSKDKLSLIQISNIEAKFKDIFKIYKLNKSSVDKKIIEQLEVNIKLENALLHEKDSSIVGDKSSKFSSAIATGLSYAMGFMMYMVIFIFGSMVMRSVMEEKISRIVEVMISSIKPFQLMLGKIIGVGLVGLTQLGIWMILIPMIGLAVAATMGGDAAMAASPQAQQAAEAVKQLGENGNTIQMFMTELKAMNWLLILPSFVIFFFGGYFIYSALFAAVGSAVGDDIGESQQLMMPITIPVILALVMVPAVFNNPNGPLAIFGSLFPLFSPIIMPARLPFNPPLWQVALSILFLIGGVIFFTWIAGRIYRVGILMYGKKVGFKELGKWIFYKD
jgi:ABC-2 type transport system permease protein